MQRKSKCWFSYRVTGMQDEIIMQKTNKFFENEAKLKYWGTS